MFNQNMKFHWRVHRLLGSLQSLIFIHAFTSLYRSEFRRFGFLVSLLNGTIKSGPDFHCVVRLLHSCLHRKWCVRLPKAVGAFSVEISYFDTHANATAVCRLFRFSRTTTATFLCWSGDFDFPLCIFLFFSLSHFVFDLIHAVGVQ